MLQLSVFPEINDTTDASDKENEDPQDKEVILGESNGEETARENSI